MVWSYEFRIDMAGWDAARVHGNCGACHVLVESSKIFSGDIVPDHVLM